MNAARPLPPADRGPFLEAVAREPQDQPAVGDGSLHRIMREVQRKYFDKGTPRTTTKRATA